MSSRLDAVPRILSIGPEIEKGAWIWESPNHFSEQEAKEMLAFASKNGVNTLYLRIDEYIDLWELKNVQERNSQISDFVAELRLFNKLARQYGIRVDALGGHSYWSEDSHHYITPILVDFVDSFNRSSKPDERFSGIQFDVEPHGQDGFDDEQNQARILKNYIAYVENTVEYTESKVPGLRIGFVIPYWYDQQTRQLVTLSYHNLDQSIFDHMVSILNSAQKMDSYIVVMAYRNFAEGSNGTIELAEYEVSHSESSNVKIIIGQETTDVEPNRITFYGFTKEYMNTQLELIKRKFIQVKNFGGFAIHDLQGWMQLRYAEEEI